MRPTTLAPVGLLAPSTFALAADGSLDVAGSVFQMFLGLALILGLLYATLLFLKRFGGGGAGGANLLKVRGAAPVGPRERVVLVEVAGKVLVLGVAPGRVNTLHTLDATELPPATGENTLLSGGKDFQAWLKQTLERRP
jgi:flagellar protein FliO/FliZ